MRISSFQKANRLKLDIWRNSPIDSEKLKGGYHGKHKPKPHGVPDENVYDNMHLTLYIALLAVIADLYLLVVAG